MKRFVLLVALAACGDNKPVERPQPPAPQPERAQPPAPPPPRQEGPPVARIENVRDTYHGVAVDDPYRWLEGETAEVKEWSAGQNAYARKILDALPDVAALREEVDAIIRAPITHYFGVMPAGRKIFVSRKQPTKEQSELIVVDDLDNVAAAKLVLDPTAGGNTHRAIDWYVPAPDGTKVAVSISEGGSESGDLHILDLGGKLLEPPIPNVQRGTGGGHVAWTPDGRGLYYTRYPAAGEKPENERDFWMQVWFHALGTPVARDRYELGKELPKIAEIRLQTDRKGRVIANVQNGDGGEFRHYLRDAKGTWRQLSDWKDGVTYLGFGTTNDLWLVSTNGAPRGKAMLLAPGQPLARAKLIVPEDKHAIVTDFWSERGILDAGDRIYVTYQLGGPMELRAFTRTGKPAKGPALPPVSSSSKPDVLRDGSVIVDASSYSSPRAIYRYDRKAGATTVIAPMSPKPPVDLSGIDVVREHATSKDGTRVPFSVLWPRGAARDGSQRCLVTGYGGYGVSESPHYPATFAPLLTRGICVVFTNLRGGGEFGEDWHRAGALTHKQNVFDDFAAVLKFLVAEKYTSSERLAIIGGSNGGLLMGAIVTQHPQLVKAVVAAVGIFDSVRAERAPNGEFNVTEFGTVKDKAQFDAIRAYSPYHQVRPRTRYPAVLMTAGENDPRVPPWHSRKMTAALQAAQSSDAPILLRTSSTAGHGRGTSTSERVNDIAHVMAFVLWQLR
jgi:prolyl oligopeptidase